MNKIKKNNVITGKGMRSKNFEDPYQSKDLSILKYSVPEYIKNNNELMKSEYKTKSEKGKSTLESLLSKKLILPLLVIKP